MINKSNSIPKKSSEYLFAESIFYEQFNEVEFFFEDENKEELYFLILRKLFTNINFSKIFTLNGKDSVIEKADKSITKKKRVFIVDKDFDDLLGIQRTDLRNLFYLEKYSIENYFFEESAILYLIISNIPSIKRNDIKLKYPTLMKEIITNVKTITCYFFIAHKNQIPNLKSMSLPLEMFFCDSTCARLNKSKLNDYKRKISSAFKNDRNMPKYRMEVKNAKTHLQYDSEYVFNNLSGKHCIQLLIKILKRKYPKIGNLQFDKVCYNIASNSEFSQLHKIRDSINTFIS